MTSEYMQENHALTTNYGDCKRHFTLNCVKQMTFQQMHFQT